MLSLMDNKTNTRGLRPIHGYRNYLVSKDGEVFSLRSGTLRQLKKTLWHKYYHVGLRLEGGQGSATYPVHRLVAEAFLPSPPSVERGFPHLRHLNGDRFDNRACNLKWGSAQDNALDRVRHGTTLRGEKNPGAKLTVGKVQTIRKLLSKGWTQQELADRYEVTQNCIDHINRGITWAHLPNPYPKGRKNQKLSTGDVKKIKALLKKGVPQHVIASQFGVWQTNIGRINRGETWSHVDG